MKNKPLERSFFARDTRVVARELLGMRLVRVLDDGLVLSGRIVETEAYREDDAASHSFRRKTVRNAPMFGKAGLAYVYFIYGMHFCFNVTTEEENRGAAVLIRACEPLEGVEAMRLNRHGGQTVPSSLTAQSNLLRGPANLSKALRIDRALNGYDTLEQNSVLYFAKDEDVPQEQVGVSPRIGVRGDQTALTALWRWYVKDSVSVSGR